MFGLKPSRALPLLIAVLGGVAIGAGAWLLTDTRRPSLLSADLGVGGPFTLIDQDGRTRSDSEFRGKIMVVEFGYTFCPDVCPLGLQLIADVLDDLGPDADSVQSIFITVDPARDTPEMLGPYVDHFSPSILGLSGPEKDIAAVAKSYRVYYKLAADHLTNPNYSVDHSAIIYLMDRNGKFIGHFTHDTPPEQVAAAIRSRL